MCGLFQIRADRRLVILAAALISLFIHSAAANAAEYFVATDGRSNDDGSFDRPLDLVTALGASSPARPGDTIWIRGGVYSGYFRCDLLGAPASPIVVRPYNNERVILDGIGIRDRASQTNILDIRGSDVHFWNLEVRDSLTQRSYPDRNTIRPIGISVYGQRVKLINPIVHDAGNAGIGLWNSGDTEVYGAVVFNNGYMRPAPSGHGIYIQNDSSTTTTRVTDSVSFNNFQMGMHAYGEGGTIEGLAVDQFVSFNNGSPSLGASRRDANLFVGPRTNPADRISITRSHAYHPSLTAGVSVRLGYTAANRSATVRGNYFVGGSTPMTFTTWNSVTFENNTVLATRRPANMTFYERLVVAQNLSYAGPYTFRNNAYFDQTTPEGGTTYHPFEIIPVPTGFIGTFAQWQTAMGDWTSSYQIARPPNRVFVMPNKYERGRAHIVVHNWSRSGSVSVDLSQTGLTSGQAFEIWDVQNLSGSPLVTGTYSGSVTIPLNLTKVLQPIGWTQTIAHTDPEFGLFLLTPVAAPTAPSTPAAAVSLTSPVQGYQGTAPANLTLAATASISNDQVRDVSFYAGNTLVGTDQSSPYTATIAGVAAGTYLLQAKVTGMSGVSAMSNTVSVTVTAPSGGTASFLRTDSTTQGNWKNVYGAQGYSIASDTTSLPSFAKATPSGHSTWTWAASTTDIRALMLSTAGYRAATWYATAFNIDLAFSDGQAHQVAIYALDWDKGGRAQQFEVLDAATGTLLDRRSVSSFTGGQYWIWQVTGAVRIRVTRQAGYNAVVSGVFIDAVQTSTTQAVFLKADSTTRGDWTGVYGKEGYGIANGTTALPKYANVTQRGSAAWTWASPTGDIRALKNGTSRIASTWYASQFSIDVAFSDGQPHQVALHAIDWDSGGRSQTIEVKDGVTGAVLDRRALSSFAGGLYLVWRVAGKVTFTVTRTAGYNAVVGGLFVD